MTLARAVILAALAVAAPWAIPAAAGGDPAPQASLVRGVSDGRVFGNEDPALRAGGIAVAHQVGARFARLQITWSNVVAPSDSFERPAAQLGPLSDPSSLAYRWNRLDSALRDLHSAGLTPVVYFVSAPVWAQSAPLYAAAASGTWAPRPSDLADFASAVARRYDGTYPDPLDPETPLPRVAHFQTWNEPNLARYLEPQWVGVDGKPSLYSARWYRRMHTAAYAAIHARQRDASVALAGLAPSGDESDGSGRVAPMRFLRSLLCVDGTEASCGPPLPFDAIALHPLSTGDPDRPAARVDDIAIADLQPKLDALLARARATGRLAVSAHPELWITEVNWTTDDANGITAAHQPAVIGRAMMRLAQAGAVMVNWQFVTDPPRSRTSGFARPAGLTTAVPGDARFMPGAAKRFLSGFSFPVAAVAVGKQQAYVWALPAAGTPRRLVLERRSAAGWSTVLRVPVNVNGTAAALVNLPYGTIVRWRDGATLSPVVRVQLRLGGLRASNPGRSGGSVAKAQRLALPIDDPRLADPDGPGAFLSFPPLVLGGTPPSIMDGPIPPIAAPTRAAHRLTFRGTRGPDVIIGSSSADRILGLGGNDLLLGLGGDDRIDGGAGRDTVAANRVALTH